LAGTDPGKIARASDYVCKVGSQVVLDDEALVKVPREKKKQGTTNVAVATGAER
jgi:hypothetical protein